MILNRCGVTSLCGGHGDRLNGLLGVFLLAVASRRAFFIDSPSPVPLHLLFSPRSKDDNEFFLDWRMHGAVGTGRRINYVDRYNDLVADLPWLLTGDTEPVLVLQSNQRLTMEILRSTEARALMGTLAEDLAGIPFLHAELLELLFEPTTLLAERFADHWRVATGGRHHVVAIHLRTGNGSPEKWHDPPRHKLSDLNLCIECAALVEQRVGWNGADVAWYVASDTADVVKVATGEKLTFLPPDADAAIVHLDRSAVELTVLGVADTWAQWLVIARADAVVLSTSGFGVTAAEAGRVRHAFLGPHDCVMADLTAP